MISLTFREASTDDAPELAGFINAAYRGEGAKKGWTTEADLLSGTRIDSQEVCQKINTPKSHLIMAHDAEGKLTACCEVLCHESNVAYFGLFAVDPLRQAGGIGRQVLDKAEAFCREKWQCPKIEMQVIWTRTELISWYERRGYVLVPGVTRPFPFQNLQNGQPLREDLHFVVLEKAL